MLKKEFRKRAIKGFMKKASDCTLVEDVFKKYFPEKDKDDDVDYVKFIDGLRELFIANKGVKLDAQGMQRFGDLTRRRINLSKKEEIDEYNGLVNIMLLSTPAQLSNPQKPTFINTPSYKKLSTNRAITKFIIRHNTVSHIENEIEKYEQELLKKLIDQYKIVEKETDPGKKGAMEASLKKCLEYFIHKSEYEDSYNKAKKKAEEEKKAKKKSEQKAKESENIAKENEKLRKKIIQLQEQINKKRTAETDAEIKAIEDAEKERKRLIRERIQRTKDTMLTLPGLEKGLETDPLSLPGLGNPGLQTDPMIIEYNRLLRELQERMIESEGSEEGEEEGSLRRLPRHRGVRPTYDDSSADSFFSYAKKLVKFKK